MKLALRLLLPRRVLHQQLPQSPLACRGHALLAGGFLQLLRPMRLLLQWGLQSVLPGRFADVGGRRAHRAVAAGAQVWFRYRLRCPAPRGSRLHKERHRVPGRYQQRPTACQEARASPGPYRLSRRGCIRFRVRNKFRRVDRPQPLPLWFRVGLRRQKVPCSSHLRGHIAAAAGPNGAGWGEDGRDMRGTARLTNQTNVARAQSHATRFPDHAIQRTRKHLWSGRGDRPGSLHSGSKSCTCRAVSEFVTTLPGCRRIRPVLSTFFCAQQAGGAV